MSKRRGGHGGGHASTERWLLTYADLITLLLAFFIILYAMSVTDHKKVDDLSRAMSSAFHVTSGAESSVLSGQPAVLIGGNSILPESQKLLDMQQTLEAAIAKEHGAAASSAVTTGVNERGLVISLANSAFFESGDAMLRPESMDILNTVAKTLAASGRQIMIEGHTDNTPIHTLQFPSNWELSTTRATTVVRYLIASHKLPPVRLSAAGYGEYKPLVGNATSENRAKNRRVDIVIIRSDARGQRPGGQL